MPGVEARHRPSRSDHLVAGARDGAGWLLALVPYGFVIGVTIEQVGFPTGPGWATGALLVGGSAQLVVIQLGAEGAATAVVLAAVVAVQARLVLYATALAPHWREASLPFRLLAAYFIVEPSFAIGTRRYGEGDRVGAHHHYLAGSATVWLGWQVAIGLGILLGGGLPAALGLAAIVPMFLVGELAPRLRTRPGAVAAVVAGVTAVGAGSVPHHLGLLLAIAAGIAAAVAVEGRR